MEPSYRQAGVNNPEYVDQIYKLYQQNPRLVPESWAYFFQGLEFASYNEQPAHLADEGDLKLLELIRQYRRRGHTNANVNPLYEQNSQNPILELENFGFTQADLDKEFPTYDLLPQKKATLRQIISILKETYCNKIGLEYIFQNNQKIEKWFQEKIEPNRNQPNLSLEDKRAILGNLNRAELFEVFLHTKYVGQKRFSLEGAEVLIPALNETVQKASELGVNEIVIGMPHRGRLNVLANVLNKSYEEIFTEFESNYDINLMEGSGDVKYHKGFSSAIKTRCNKELTISVAANPSHLEAISPVCLGRTRAKQVLKGDVTKKKIMSIVIHGDAAVAGQGIVYECLQMSNLPNYSVGGTLHIVVNNQIGFTTVPSEARSSQYCTDIAKIIGAPVFHVNGEDPEAVIHCVRVALEYLNEFGTDVMIDIVCYRKHGHNEGDEPSFTSPVEYKTIRSKLSVRQIYRNMLIEHGHVEKDLADELEAKYKNDLNGALTEIRKAPSKLSYSIFDGAWKNYRKVQDSELFDKIDTAVSRSQLDSIFECAHKIPDGFTINPKLLKLIKDREQLYFKTNKIDWAIGELLAFGLLLTENYHVRLSGQDSKRGTFSHRHAAWYDESNGKEYIALKNIREGQAVFDVINSPLNEYACLGFEFGYSLGFPNALVLWEAQFGDFVNGAQVILDQFFCTAEQKWNRYSGLVLLLPHGLEGQGPEHSSARIERILNNSAQNNIQVTIPTTPAQLFHLLRRQVMRAWRRPLVICTPKAYLRHPLATSTVEEITSGTFEEVIPDPNPPAEIKQLIFCTGKVYFDLIQERAARNATGVVIHRLEQIYPFHRQKIKDILATAGTKKMYWVQEEPLNQGANLFVKGRFMEVKPKKMKFVAIGRKESASPAVGSIKQHQAEFKKLMDEVFSHSQEG